MPFPLEEKQGLFIRGPPDVELNLEEKEDGCHDEIPDIRRDIRKSNVLILRLSETVKVMTRLEAESPSIIQKKLWLWENQILK